MISYAELVNCQSKKRSDFNFRGFGRGVGLSILINFSDCLIYEQGEEVDYRGVLHRDGSVLMSVSLDQLKVIIDICLSILLITAILL